MRQTFLTKMYDYESIGGDDKTSYTSEDMNIIARQSYEAGKHDAQNTPTPQTQGYSLQQVSDAWDSGQKYSDHMLGNDMMQECPPNREQYLATLTPAPDVKEVAVAFAEFIEFECYFDNDGWRCYKMDKDAISYSGYENIYPGVIEQSKK